MPLLPLQLIFSHNLANLIMFANSKNIGVSVREVERTKEQQALYFKSGKSHSMESQHLKSLAVDLFFFYPTSLKQLTLPSELEPFVTHWKELDVRNRCGADWGWDWCHYEMLG